MEGEPAGVPVGPPRPEASAGPVNAAAGAHAAEGPAGPGSRARPSRRRAVLVGLLLAAPAVLWFSPALLGRVLLAAIVPLCDQWHINVPFGYLLADAFHHGRLPLWTDRVGGGYPLLALGEAGALYPPHLILYRLLPPLAAYHANVFLAVLLASVWTYLLCRDLGRSRAASLLAGWAFAFSGYFVTHVATLHSAQAAAWAPALLLAARRAVRRNDAPSWALAGAVLAVQITTGYPQIVYYSLLAAGALAVWECAGAPRQGWRRLSPLLGAAGALALALGLSAAHWVPGLELTRQSGRARGIPYEAVTAFTYPPANLLTFLAPYAFGNPARGEDPGWIETGHFWDNGYIGILPLLLALWVAITAARRDRRVLFLALLFLFSILVVLGPHTPAHPLLWRILPGMAFFRFPSRFMAIADLCLCLLAAFGFDLLSRRVGPAPRRRHLLGAALLTLTALDLAFFVTNFHRFVPRDPWLTPPENARFIAGSGLPAPGREREDRKSKIENRKYYTLGYSPFHLNTLDRGHGWQGDLAPYLEQKEILAPNSGVLFGLSCLNVFGGLETKRESALFRLLAEDRTLPDDVVRIPRGFPRALAKLGVTHVVTTYGLAMPGLRLAHVAHFRSTRPPVRVYEVEGARGRIWIPVRVTHAAADREALGSLVGAGDAVVEEDPGGPAGAAGEVEDASAGAGFARAQVRMGGAGYVVHNQRLYPGWQAWVDGKPARLLPANFLMQAVAVPAGAHTVEFRFDSGSFRRGRTISLLSLLLLAAGALALRGRRAPADRPDGSAP